MILVIMFFSSRTIKVSCIVAVPRWKRRYLKPKITISGNWLEKAGFSVGELINIEVHEDKLIIKKLTSQNGLK